MFHWWRNGYGRGKGDNVLEVSPLDSMADDKDQTGIGDGGGIEGDAKARPVLLAILSMP